MENLNKILIIIEGGIVQSVHASNPDTRIVIVDYDRKADDPDDTVITSEVQEPDTVTDNMYELFRDSESHDEMKVFGTLRRQDF